MSHQNCSLKKQIQHQTSPRPRYSFRSRENVNKCPCYSVKTNLARSPIRRRAERVKKKCIQVHAISSQWKAAQWSTLHIITHHYTSHAVRCCSKEPGASTTLQDFQAESPLEMQLHICKSPDIYGSLFISKIRPMNGKMAFRMVLHLTFCRGGGPALQAGVRPFPIVNKWDQIVSNSKMLISVCFSKV